MCFLGNFCLKIYVGCLAAWTVCWMFHGQLLGQVLLEDYLECLFFVHCSAMPCFAKEVFTSQRNFNQLFFCTNHCFVHGIHMVTEFSMQNFFVCFFGGGRGELPKMLVTFFQGASGYL